MKAIPIEIGYRNGFLTVVKQVHNQYDSYGVKLRSFLVRCDCGNERILSTDQVLKRTKCSRTCQAQRNSTPPINDGEEWKHIEEYEGMYMVSNLGRIWSCKSGKIIRPRRFKNGYYGVNLGNNNKFYNVSIARMVAKYFVPNPNNYSEVNHIDEDKSNNKASNLEWCTRKYNCNYGKRNDAKARPVLQYSKDGFFISEYKSTREAMRQTGTQPSAITLCCQGKYKSAGGFIWKYKE